MLPMMTASERNRLTVSRLTHELEELRRNTPMPIISASPIDDNLFHWKAVLKASDHSPYANGLYLLHIEVPKFYPCSPLRIKIVTPIYHPNVNENGDIDLKALREGWSPALTIKTVLVTIGAVINEPINMDKYLEPNYAENAKAFQYNKECVLLYTHYRLLYEEKANECAVQYAQATKQYSLNDTFVAIRDLLIEGFGREQAYDLETTVIELIGLDIRKLREWCWNLGLQQDVRYKHLINVTAMNKQGVTERQLMTVYCPSSSRAFKSISVWNDSSIKQFRQQVSQTINTPLKQCRLVYKGIEMRDNDALLIHYGIGDGSDVQVVMAYEDADIVLPVEPIINVQQPPASYTGVHSASNTVSSSRHNPMSSS